MSILDILPIVLLSGSKIALSPNEDTIVLIPGRVLYSLPEFNKLISLIGP